MASIVLSLVGFGGGVLAGIVALQLGASVLGAMTVAVAVGNTIGYFEGKFAS